MTRLAFSIYIWIISFRARSLRNTCLFSLDKSIIWVAVSAAGISDTITIFAVGVACNAVDHVGCIIKHDIWSFRAYSEVDLSQLHNHGQCDRSVRGVEKACLTIFESRVIGSILIQSPIWDHFRRRNSDSYIFEIQNLEVGTSNTPPPELFDITLESILRRL